MPNIAQNIKPES